jgi:hypothetical protein
MLVIECSLIRFGALGTCYVSNTHLELATNFSLPYMIVFVQNFLFKFLLLTPNVSKNHK